MARIRANCTTYGNFSQTYFAFGPVPLLFSYTFFFAPSTVWFIHYILFTSLIATPYLFHYSSKFANNFTVREILFVPSISNQMYRNARPIIIDMRYRLSRTILKLWLIFLQRSTFRMIQFILRHILFVNMAIQCMPFKAGKSGDIKTPPTVKAISFLDEAKFILYNVAR